MSEYTLSQVMQALERMVMVATVIERDGAKARVKWSEDGAESDWLAIAQLGSEVQKFWIPPTPGTQVVVISPGGDTTRGIIFPGPFMAGVPAGNFDGTFTGEGDLVASSISLVNHVHEGVTPGPGNSGKPV